MKTLYVFVDESGNFDFSPGGTKCFVLTALSTIHPFGVGSPLLALRYRLLPDYSCGERMADEGFFHASEDRQHVRDSVFKALLSMHEHIRLDTVIAQKNRTNPSLQRDEIAFYSALGKPLLRYAFNRAKWDEYEHVVLVFSSLFNQKKRGILKQTFKSLIKKEAEVPFALYFHDSKFDLCTQATDYFGWAVYRKWESNDCRSYDTVKHMVRSEFPIFAKGTTEYYSHQK